ncbi:TetR/AcrR family transcriptional regulator [Roseobacteraceae bacterium NS-SX3]
MGNKIWTKAAASRSEQRELKRRAVLLAGARLFNDQGYEQTSLEDIAAALNITKRTIYYYVQSKEDILFGCHQLGLEFLGDVMAQSADESLPVVERIRVLIRGYCAWVSTDLGASLAMVREHSLPPARRAELHGGKARVDFQLRALIEQGIREGAVRHCEPRLVAAAVFGALNWIPFWNRTAKPVPHEEIAEQYLAMVLNGLLPGKA